MSVSEKMRKAGAEVLWSLADTEGDGPAFERAAEEMYLKMQAADDTTVSVNEAIKLADAAADHAAAAADEERNRLRGALRRVRAWLAGYVANGGKDADEELQIADAALTADDGAGEEGMMGDQTTKVVCGSCAGRGCHAHGNFPATRCNSCFGKGYVLRASPTPDEPKSDGVKRWRGR